VSNEYKILYADTEQELNKLLDTYYVDGWGRLNVTEEDGSHLIDVSSGKHCAYIYRRENEN